MSMEMNILQLLLKKKIIGKEISISITHNTNKFKEKKKDSWWMKNNLGGGELNAIGSHLIDLVQFIFGDISQFNGAIKNYKNKNLSIDLGFILNLKFLKNKIGLLQSSCNSKNNKGLSINIVGEKGEIILNNFNNLIIKKNLNKKKIIIKDKLKNKKNVGINPWRRAQVHYLNHITSCILKKKKFTGSEFNESLKNVTIMAICKKNRIKI